MAREYSESEKREALRLADEIGPRGRQATGLRIPADT